MATVPASGPPLAAGFTPGDVFIGRGVHDEISRLSGGGAVIADVFVDLGTNSGVWGGLAFDTAGSFGGRLVAATTAGHVFLVDHTGGKVLLTNLGRRLEGVDVAPAEFGPLGGQIVVGVEGFNASDPEGGKVYAVNAQGAATLLADIGVTAEEIRFVPASGGTYYQAELCFDRERENRLLMATASQFLSRLGRLIVVNELGGELWEVAWNGTDYTQSLIGRAPGRWSSEGWGVQDGTEFEAGCFAARAPNLPTWSPWSAVPGDGTTDRAPAAAVDAMGNLHVLAKGLQDRRVYLNSRAGAGSSWSGWAEVPPGGLTTAHALAMALHDKVLHAFAIGDGGAIMHKRLFDAGGALLNEPWTEVPGGGRADAAVAAATVNGHLVLVAKGIQDRQLYLNELAAGGRRWSGWQQVPGGGQTDQAPAVVGFQDELYLLIKGLSSGHILAKARSTEGRWTDWSQLPGAGVADVSVAAVAAAGQLYVFGKGVNDRAPYWNVASDTGTWSGWHALPEGGTTDTALASAAIGDRLFLVGKGVTDGHLYVRSTP